MSYLEERAALARLAAGFTGVVPRGELVRVIDWLMPVLQVEANARVSRAQLVRTRSGRGLMCIPARLTLGEIDQAQLHELAHYLARHGLASLWRRHGDMDDPRERAMADAIETQEEREAEEFLLALLLPAPLTAMVRSDTDLADLAGVTVELVRQRRLQLRSRPSVLSEVPRWSAFHCYRVTLCRLRSGSRVWVEPRRDGPAFEVPVLPGDEERATWQINVDLMALHEDEFQAKYAGYQWIGAEPAGLGLSDAFRIADRLVMSG